MQRDERYIKIVCRSKTVVYMSTRVLALTLKAIVFIFKEKDIQIILQDIIIRSF